MIYSPKEYTFQRDKKYPIRLTLQRYRVTDEGKVSIEVFDEISEVINALYNNAAAGDKGSLVVDGNTGRMTESTGTMPNPVAGSLSSLF